MNWGVRNRHQKLDEGGGGVGVDGNRRAGYRGVNDVLKVPMTMVTIVVLMDLILSVMIDSFI